MPGDFSRAEAIAPDGRRVAETTVKGHSYRLVAPADAAATASVQLVNDSGRATTAYTPLLPPDVDVLFPQGRPASAAEIQSFTSRMPALVPESLRRLDAPPRPDGATIGGEARIWHVGATQRYFCLWIGNGSSCTPSPGVRESGISSTTLPADAPTNEHAAARYHGIRPEPAGEVSAVDRNGRVIETAPVVGQAYDLYVSDASAVAYLEFSHPDGSTVRTPG